MGAWRGPVLVLTLLAFARAEDSNTPPPDSTQFVREAPASGYTASSNRIQAVVSPVPQPGPRVPVGRTPAPVNGGVLVKGVSLDIKIPVFGGSGNLRPGRKAGQASELGIPAAAIDSNFREGFASAASLDVPPPSIKVRDSPWGMALAVVLATLGLIFLARLLSRSLK